MNILVVRFGSIGDIILTTPVLRLLRKAYPDAHIAYLTKPQFVGLIKPNKHLNEVLPFHSVSQTRKAIKMGEYNLLIDLHSSLRSRLVTTFHWKKKRLVVDKKNFTKWLMVNRKQKKSIEHMAIRNMDTLAPLGIEPDALGLEHHIPVETAAPIDIKESTFSSWAIGGQHGTKKMPLEKLMEIARTTTTKTYILGGKEDEETGNALAAQNDLVVNLAGQTSLHQSALILKHSRVLLTHDTGMMHVAAAFKIPILSVWGNTVPEFGMSPYLPNPLSKQFEVNDLPCRPCSKIGHNECPKKHFKCMENQDIAALTSVWNSLSSKDVV